jgi:hypothetical protein
MLVQTSAYESYQKFMSRLVRSFYLKLDWEENLVEDTWTERYNFIFEVFFFNAVNIFTYFRKIRTSVVSFACLRGVEECVEKAKNRYKQWMMNEAVNP